MTAPEFRQPEAQPIPEPLQQRVQSVLLGEHPTSTEAHPQVEFSQVVFGHAYADFDLDQLVTYYIALKAGYVKPNTPIAFNAAVGAELQNTSTMVIEGFAYPPELGDAKNSSELHKQYLNGNFTNLPGSDLPAAILLRRFAGRAIENLPAPEKKWLSYVSEYVGLVDTQNYNAKIPDTVLTQLKPVNQILHALKDKYPDLKDWPLLLTESLELLEKASRNYLADQNKEVSAYTAADFETEYAELIQTGRAKLEDFSDRLAEAITNPERFKTSRTASGLQLTMFDTRGLNVSKGAFAAALRKQPSDIVILVDDPPESTGELKRQTQIKIRLLRPEFQNGELVRELAGRLNQTERLFGVGYNYIELSQYGGHESIVSSPQAGGSDLGPEYVWASLLRFANQEILTESAFKAQAAKLAAALDIAQYGFGREMPNTPYELEKQVVSFSLPGDPEHKQGAESIKLSERDLPLYLACMGQDSNANRQLLRQKTVLTEPQTVLELRVQKALPLIDEYTQQGDYEQIFSTLDELNPVAVQEIPFATQLKILELIAQHPQAIDMIWNPDNVRFAIRSPKLPDEIKSTMERYRLARYQMQSVAFYIDNLMMDSLRRWVPAQQNQRLNESFATTIRTILNSEAYRAAHDSKHYDQLLESYLLFCLELYGRRQTDAANSTVQQLLQEYGTSQNNHWLTVNRTILQNLAKVSPEFKQFVSALTPEADNAKLTDKEHGHLPNLLNAPVWHKKPNALRAELESVNRPHTISLLIEVSREIISDVERAQFLTPNGQYEPVTVDCYAKIPHLNLDRGDHLNVIKGTIAVLREYLPLLVADPTLKLRIIRGGFLNRLSGQMQSHVEKSIRDFTVAHQAEYPDINAELLIEQLCWSDFDATRLRYYDSPLVEDIKQ